MGAYNEKNNTVAGIKLAYPRPTALDRFSPRGAASAIEDSKLKVEIVKPLGEHDGAIPAFAGDIGHTALDGLTVEEN
ncbi:MAG: hypothetical protein U0524_02365 [Candidatus Saccharimonadales bacterium]